MLNCDSEPRQQLSDKGMGAIRTAADFACTLQTVSRKEQDGVEEAVATGRGTQG